MYKPRSPTASNKTVNFSPSPQGRRKTNNHKGYIQEQNISSKVRSSYGSHLQQKQQKKTTLLKKSTLKAIQVDPSQLVDSFKLKQSSNNNQTPKFCMKIDNSVAFGKPRTTAQLPSNFFSFGEKSQQKMKTQRKINNKQSYQKQQSKSPKQIKKKPTNNISFPKSKLDIGTLQITNKQKKSNQSYLR